MHDLSLSRATGAKLACAVLEEQHVRSSSAYRKAREHVGRTSGEFIVSLIPNTPESYDTWMEQYILAGNLLNDVRDRKYDEEQFDITLSAMHQMINMSAFAWNMARCSLASPKKFLAFHKTLYDVMYGSLKEQEQKHHYYPKNQPEQLKK